MKYFALVPAAGSGSRMGSHCPKQYLPLAGRPLIFHTLLSLCCHPRLDGVAVVLSADDEHWPQYDWAALGEKLTVLRCGGATRAESVTNGLEALSNWLSPDDWVLVHDAARPCLTTAHIDRLIDNVGASDAGGILAVPVADTLKRGESNVITETVPRSGLWQAQTPQMFRHGQLWQALVTVGDAVTDEASAIEAIGLHPRLVAADATNLKVTYPLDLQLAEWILQNRKVM